MLSMEPHLFEEAVDAQLERLAADAASAAAAANVDSSEVTLYRRIEDVKRRARSQSVQDLMYFSVLRKFMSLGVDLLPPLDGSRDVGSADLVKLTKGVHSLEALEMVREHLENVLRGNTSSSPPPFASCFSLFASAGVRVLGVGDLPMKLKISGHLVRHRFREK